MGCLLVSSLQYWLSKGAAPGWDCRLSPVSMTPGKTEMTSEFCLSRLKVVDVAPAVWMSTWGTINQEEGRTRPMSRSTSTSMSGSRI